jgi:chloramphenicol 3-O phosphotransferase
VVTDHVFIEREWVHDLATTVVGLRVWLIGVHCLLELLAVRERERGDRRIGLAANHYRVAHRHGLYDLEIDTSTAAPETLAIRIKELVESETQPSALVELASRPVQAR